MTRTLLVRALLAGTAMMMSTAALAQTQPPEPQPDASDAEEPEEEGSSELGHLALGVPGSLSPHSRGRMARPAGESYSGSRRAQPLQLVRHDTHGPVRVIGFHRLRPIGHNLFRCQSFLARAKGAESCGQRPGAVYGGEVVRPSATFCRNNDPATDNRITS